MNLTLPELILRRKLDKTEHQKLPGSDPYYVLTPGQFSAVALDEANVVVSWVDDAHCACQMFVYRSDDDSEWISHPQLLYIPMNRGLELRPIPLALANDQKFMTVIDEAQRKRTSRKRKPAKQEDES